MKCNNYIILLIVFILSCSPNKPKVLIIGDSISSGYFPYVKKDLSGKYNVRIIKGNAKHTRYGLMNFGDWIGNTNWDIIQFNWGLWDLCYRKYSDTNMQWIKDKIEGKQEIPLEEYKSNLESIVKILKKTNATLIFVTTTFIPLEEPGMKSEDVLMYNSVAKKIMKNNSIFINDIYLVSKEIHAFYGISKNNVHYTDNGYREISKSITTFFNNELNKKYYKK